MQQSFVKVGDRIVNLAMLCDVNLHRGSVFLNLASGGYIRLEGDAAREFLGTLEALIVEIPAIHPMGVE